MAQRRNAVGDAVLMERSGLVGASWSSCRLFN